MSIYDSSGSQGGDQHVGNVAGGSINDPQPWLAFFKGYLHDLDQARKERDDELRHGQAETRKAFARLSDEFELYQAAIGNALVAIRERQRTDRILAITAVALAALALVIAVLL